jgi:predicted anti-sigma-YlaC factor YlaD
MGKEKDLNKRKKLSCKEIFSSLSLYLDKELDDSLCKEINRHMSKCNSCKAFLNSLSKTAELCKKFQPKEFSRIPKVDLHKALEKELEAFIQFIQKTR